MSDRKRKDILEIASNFEGNLIDYVEKLTKERDLYKSVLNEVRDRIQDDIKENEELYSDTSFIIEHENMDLYDYLKILNKVGGSNE